jgi:hypothetical protein
MLLLAFSEKKTERSEVRERKNIIYIDVIRKIYNMAQVTKKKLEKNAKREKNIIIINFLKRNG